MSTINNAILFVASYSKESGPCQDIIKHYNLPVNIIYLDTEEDRLRAENGKYFSITHVPTLVLEFVEGNIQLFIGSVKIIALIKSMVQPPGPSSRVPEPSSTIVIDEDSDEDIIPEKIPKNKPTRALRAPVSSETGKNKHRDVVLRRSKKDKVIEPEYEPEDEQPVYVDEPEEEQEIVFEEKKKSKKDTSKKAHRSKKSKKLPEPNNGLSTASNNNNMSMKHLTKMAKKMQEERDNTLGYNVDEDDPP
jgi:hypothetical protein